MKIKHYSYNAFTIEEGDNKIAIDPGQNLGAFNKYSLIPKSEWKGVTHILVSHGDPDHFAFALSMAEKTGALVLCGERLLDDFAAHGLNEAYAVTPGETISLGGLSVSGVKVHHGPLPIKMAGGLLSVTGQVREDKTGGQEVYLAGIRLQRINKPLEVYSHGTIKLLFGLIRLEKDNLDFARGAVGFHIQLNGKSILNLGDSLLQDEWKGLAPDVLMIPIGGGKVPNTMDVPDALKAVEMIDPKLVMPCHYNVPYGFIKNVNPADDIFFREEVNKMGKDCKILAYGEEIAVNI
jgi:L-ascorbate metabolism protein UlaG (beta-lactamase superfamily)